MPTLIAQTGQEPVTVDEARLAARFDPVELNADIGEMISAARQQAEHITGRRYRPQTWRFEFTAWPAASYRLPVHEPTACQISWWDGAQWQVLAPAVYEFAGVCNGSTAIAPAPGNTWPQPAAKAIGATIRVDITSGAATPAAVPECVKRYIKANVAAWLENPSASEQRDYVPNPLFANLLDAERLWV